MSIAEMEAGAAAAEIAGPSWVILLFTQALGGSVQLARKGARPSATVNVGLAQRFATREGARAWMDSNREFLGKGRLSAYTLDLEEPMARYWSPEAVAGHRELSEADVDALRADDQHPPDTDLDDEDIEDQGHEFDGMEGGG